MVRNGKKRKEIMEEDRRNSFQFVRIVFAGRSSDPLRIPSEFLDHISSGLSNRATLKVHSAGCSWNVKVSERSSGGIFIEDGWQQFVKDNSLGNNEILLFKYVGNMCFSIKIFEVDGCKRDNVPLISTHQLSASFSGKRPAGRLGKNPSSTLHHHRPSKSCEDGSGKGHPCCESYKPKKIKAGKGIELEDDRARPVRRPSKDHTARDWKAAAESF
ncbi:hypothetical protein FNV43_RR22764 [Rhamnella rubrinervis]|uniref:TF-B3 domain-containing protein n=1 Tax=Rhamnella rubrinervis TaxID=2594499 RepID=A0A8K0GSS4_9ROSA|nr:hypothetical protein FNV43_RR22764 [Rhamnella rubrinervis]